jgi:hypothetical protein
MIEQLREDLKDLGDAIFNLRLTLSGVTMNELIFQNELNEVLEDVLEKETNKTTDAK